MPEPETVTVTVIAKSLGAPSADLPEDDAKKILERAVEEPESTRKIRERFRLALRLTLPTAPSSSAPRGCAWTSCRS